MNILWITLESILPANSGGRIGVFKRLEQLSKNNEVYLFYPFDESQEIKYKKELEKYCKEVHAYKRKNKIHAFKDSIRLPFTVASRKINTMTKDISKCIKNNNINIINIDFPHMVIDIIDILDEIKVPIVLNQHNIEWQVYDDIAKSTRNLFKKLIYSFDAKRLKKYEEYVYSSINIKVYTFVSQKDKMYFQTWQERLTSKTVLIPVGADLKEIKHNTNKTNCKIIAFIGKMSYAPNIEAVQLFANQIFPKILREIPECKFYVVGKEPSKNIKKLASDNVIVTGMVESVEKYYNMADVIVIPLKNGGGVKVKLLEALSNNKYIVSTTKGVEGTVFAQNNQILIGNNPEEFSRNCIELLKDPEKYKAKYEEAYKTFKNNYTWNEIGKKYFKLLNNVKKK